jgi:hypothetical protein
MLPARPPKGDAPVRKSGYKPLKKLYFGSIFEWNFITDDRFSKLVSYTYTREGIPSGIVTATV